MSLPAGKEILWCGCLAMSAAVCVVGWAEDAPTTASVATMTTEMIEKLTVKLKGS